MLKEFDICPSLVTKSMTYSLWNHILDTPSDNLTGSADFPEIIPNKKDVGYVFTLSRFYALLIRLSIIGYSNISGD